MRYNPGDPDWKYPHDELKEAIRLGIVVRHDHDKNMAWFPRTAEEYTIAGDKAEEAGLMVLAGLYHYIGDSV